MGRSILSAVLLLATASSAFADSLTYDVTPQNLSDQRLQFQVLQQPLADQSVSVTIAVASGEGAVSPQRDGRLLLWEQHSPSMVAYVSRPEEGRQRILLIANVRERVVEGKVYYNFQVTRDLVGRVTFEFINWSPGMPSCDEYGFALGEFLAKEK